MVRLNEQQAEAFVEYARSILAKHNNPPVEDAARILSFADGVSIDYVQVRPRVSQDVAVALVEGFLEGRIHRSPSSNGNATDDDD